MGIVRTVQFVATLLVAGPIAIVGAVTLLEGQPVPGAFFLATAVGLLGLSEYLYVRLTRGAVGRVRRLRDYRPWRRDRDSSGDQNNR